MAPKIKPVATIQLPRDTTFVLPEYSPVLPVSSTLSMGFISQGNPEMGDCKTKPSKVAQFDSAGKRIELLDDISAATPNYPTLGVVNDQLLKPDVNKSNKNRENTNIKTSEEELENQQVVVFRDRADDCTLARHLRQPTVTKKDKEFRQKTSKY